jgi:hypothetical protein
MAVSVSGVLGICSWESGRANAIAAQGVRALAKVLRAQPPRFMLSLSQQNSQILSGSRKKPDTGP